MTRRDRQRLRLDAAACLSLATLVFSQARVETLFRVDHDFYNRVPLAPPAMFTLLLNIVVLAAAGFVGVLAARRARRPIWRRLAVLAAVAALLIPLDYVRTGYDTVGRWMDAPGRPALLAVVVAVLAASFRWHHVTGRVVRGLLLVVSPLAALTAAHVLLLLLDLAVTPPRRIVTPALLDRTAPSLRRVVWIVLDELDQRVVFEARPADLALPELDRLHRESLHADAAWPPGGVPAISMAALITGRPVVDVAPVSTSDADLTFTDGSVKRWSALPSVFSRARSLGYDTAVVGWHLPYPRLLGAALGFADWRPAAEYDQARDDTFGRTLVSQWGSLAPALNARRLYRQRFAELGEPAIRTAADGRFGLVLLHLPVPGPPGIYDRATGRLAAWSFTAADGGYADNLALVDRVIGELRRTLERVALGDRTWIVLSATGSWRASGRYDGRVDHRVPYLVHAPSAYHGAPMDLPFNTVGTHALLQAILRGAVSDTSDAAAWIARHAVPPPRDYTSEGRPIY